jgi:hypothetical protein
MVDYVRYKNEYRIFKPVEVTISKLLMVIFILRKKNSKI